MVEELSSMKVMFAAVGMRRIEVGFDTVEQLRTLDTIVVHGWRMCVEWKHDAEDAAAVGRPLRVYTVRDLGCAQVAGDASAVRGAGAANGAWRPRR